MQEVVLRPDKSESDIVYFDNENLIILPINFNFDNLSLHLKNSNGNEQIIPILKNKEILKFNVKYFKSFWFKYSKIESIYIINVIIE